MWGIGVATQKVNLNQVPLGRDTNSLVLRHDGSVYHNNEEKNRLPANNLPQEGDIVVSANFISPDPELRFYDLIFDHKSTVGFYGGSNDFLLSKFTLLMVAESSFFNRFNLYTY